MVRNETGSVGRVCQINGFLAISLLISPCVLGVSYKLFLCNAGSSRLEHHKVFYLRLASFESEWLKRAEEKDFHVTPGVETGIVF